MVIERKNGYTIKYSGGGKLKYEYECKDCGGIQDEWHSPKSSPDFVCNSCNGNNMFRIISSPRFNLKGSGFPSKEIKIDNEISRQDEIMREGWRSKEEIKTAKAMLKEREDKLVKEGRKKYLIKEIIRLVRRS